jgi:hypothetical protein
METHAAPSNKSQAKHDPRKKQKLQAQLQQYHPSTALAMSNAAIQALKPLFYSGKKKSPCPQLPEDGNYKVADNIDLHVLDPPE